jgi:hypothetical protein
MNIKELIKQLTREVLNENELNSLSTMEKLIHRAEEDGYIFNDYGQYVLDAAKVVAKEFDALPSEEQNVMEDNYYKKFLRRIGKVNEEGEGGGGSVGNTTAAVPGYSSKFFLKNKVKESNYTQPSKFQNAKYPYNDMRGGPSLATKGGGYYATNENMNKNTKFEIGDKVTYENQKYEIIDILDTQYRLKSIKGLPTTKVLISIIDRENKKSPMNESLINIIKEELLNEVTYNKFKNEVKFRSKNEILHKAIREVKRKLSEIDRIVEYTSRMKQELSEGEEGLKYWKKTESNISTISEMINTLNNKIKNLQQ